MDKTRLQAFTSSLIWNRIHRLELSSYGGCVMWGNRIIIPTPGRQAVLRELATRRPSRNFTNEVASENIFLLPTLYLAHFFPLFFPLFYPLLQII